MALLFVTFNRDGIAAELPRSFAYVLQADKLAKTKAEAVARLRSCGRDWIIVDPVFGGDRDERWMVSDLAGIRAGRADRKVIAYLSIGEAENYRPYWNRNWDVNRDGKPDPGAPSWLHAENPDWAGNYKVRYWRGEWQRIMLGEVDRIMAQGFDGLYLDIVDAFEFFEMDGRKYIDHRPNPETGNTYRVDMMAWVGRVAQRARGLRPGALVIPQNAAQLLASGSYRASIDGIGVEDLFTDGKRAKKSVERDYTIGFLESLRPAGKPVLVIDYATKNDPRRLAVAGASERGYILLQTDRNLTALGISGGW